MAQVGIRILFCLTLFCLASVTAEELSPSIVYNLLSRRLDGVAYETMSLKSELEETKSVVNRIENKIENIEASVLAIATESEKGDEEMSEFVTNEKIQEISESVIKYEIKRQLVIVQKMLSKEKQILRERVQEFENKFTMFESSMSSKMEVKLNHSAEKIIEVENKFTTFESSMNSQMEVKLNHAAEKISEVENKFTTFESSMNSQMEVKLNHSAEKISEVKTDITRMNSDLQTSKSGIKDRLNNTENRFSSMSSKILSLERNQESQEVTFDDRMSQLSSRISEEEARKVAFTARLTKERSFYETDETIVFDQVKYSYGGGYNSSTGIFTAPKSGTYLFTFNVESASKKKAYVKLMVRGYFKTLAIVEGGPHLTGGNAGIDYLSYGDKAWIETSNNDDKYYIFPYRTTFNGVLID